MFSAATVSSTPGLSLHLAGPEIVDGVQNLKVVTTITNIGNETLKLLNDPRGPLDTIPTDTFAIQNDADEEPDFVSIRVKYVPSVAVATGVDDAFTVLAPGQSVDVEHDRKCRLFVILAPDLMLCCIQVSSAYSFTASGSGSYNIQARDNIFHYVNPSDSSIVPIQAQPAAAFRTSVSGTLAIARQS